tara:strand:+ start:4571 stop:4882 length:312 start_codon:yes stop_codon:yes gene_type:complete
MSKWNTYKDINVMKTKPLHEKNVYYTYHGYRFIAEWDKADKIYHNEITDFRGIPYVSGNSLEAHEFNTITSADVCITTANTITIKEFARIIDKWEDYIKNGNI